MGAGEMRMENVKDRSYYSREQTECARFIWKWAIGEGKTFPEEAAMLRLLRRFGSRLF
jgi:hypothetical protein